MSLEKAKEYLKKFNLESNIMEFDTSSATVEEAAKAIGCKESEIAKTLSFIIEDKPILICVWNKPDDKWTTASHYLLLLACDNDNKVYVSNPNGLYGKNKMSGWYNAEDILPYIAKAMFINE